MGALHSSRGSTILAALFASLIAYILIFTVAYTLNFRVPVHVEILLPVIRVALLFLACGYFFMARDKLSQCLDPLAICVAAILVLGAVSGLANDKSWFVYFRQGFQYAFLLAFYLIGREVGGRAIPPAAMTASSIAILFGYAMAAAIYMVTPGLQSGSYSYQPNLALLPTAWGVALSQWPMPLIGAVLIVIGNKRAVYLGLSILLAAGVALWLERRRGRSLLLRFGAITILAPAISLLLAGAISQLTSTMALPQITSAVVDRFSPQPTFNGSNAATVAPEQEAKIDFIVRFTGARSIEVAVLWDMIRNNPSEAFFGHGLGNEFTVRYISPNDYQPVQFERDQADLAPVHIAMTSGVPLAAVFTVLLGGMLLVSFMRIDAGDSTDRALALFVIASGLDIVLGFNPTNPVCWLALGIVSRRMLPEFSFVRMGSHQRSATHD